MRTTVLLAFAAAVVASVPASAAPLTSAFTDIGSCRSVDSAEDVFEHYCAGPGGMAAALLYADGRAQLVYGPASRGARDTVDEARGSADGPPLDVGNGDRVFGPKIQWLSVSGGKPCAAVVRVSTSAGSRLVVSRLAKGAKRAGVVRTNAEAESLAAKTCR